MALVRRVNLNIGVVPLFVGAWRATFHLGDFAAAYGAAASVVITSPVEGERLALGPVPGFWSAASG
jgi:hypothetical protein